MGAGSSAEQESPQDAPTAAAESEPASPEAAAAAAPLEQPEDPAKLLQKNGQISNINGIAEEQVELNLQPGELNGQQTETVVTDAVSDDDPAHLVRFKNTFTADLTKCKEGTNVSFLKIATALNPRFKNLKCLPK